MEGITKFDPFPPKLLVLVYTSKVLNPKWLLIADKCITFQFMFSSFWLPRFSIYNLIHYFLDMDPMSSHMDGARNDMMAKPEDTRSLSAPLFTKSMERQEYFSEQWF